MRLIFMCQGGQSRLPSLGGFPKQLIPIKGEPNLARTLRLVKEWNDADKWHGCYLNYEAVIVCPSNNVHWDRFRGVAGWDHSVTTYTQQKPGRCIVHGLLHTSCLWHRHGRTVVLLGDVVFSRVTLHAILENKDSIAFFGQRHLDGNHGEMFGLAFDFDQRETLLEHIVDLRCWNQYDEHQPGHLRNLLWALNPSDADRFKLRHIPALPYFVPVGVHTNDIDTEEDLAQLPSLEAVID